VSDPLVLCYHAVSAGWDADLSVTPDALERQLGLLHERGYRGTTFEEAVTSPPARRTVAVTFDDAYRSVIRLARPLLDALGWPASVYVPTAFAGSERPMSWPGIDHWAESPQAHELVPMSWHELRELASTGWEVGSHTSTHPHLTQLDDSELDRELRESRSECEQQMGRACPTIAYPYGDVDDRVVAAARAAGYRHGGALPAKHHRPRPLEWPRIGVYHADGDLRFRLKASPLVGRMRAGRLL
jgi:peptidoglycan/xylan/chitin deacetylase (PgdA/CDA1 family)